MSHLGSHFITPLRLSENLSPNPPPLDLVASWLGPGSGRRPRPAGAQGLRLRKIILGQPKKREAGNLTFVFDMHYFHTAYR